MGSRTGSLYHGVSFACLLLPPHVYPPPRSVTIVPKRSFAIMFAHGSGVTCPGASVKRKLPSASKPYSISPAAPLSSAAYPLAVVSYMRAFSGANCLFRLIRGSITISESASIRSASPSPSSKPCISLMPSICMACIRLSILLRKSFWYSIG